MGTHSVRIEDWSNKKQFFKLLSSANNLDWDRGCAGCGWWVSLDRYSGSLWGSAALSFLASNAPSRLYASSIDATSTPPAPNQHQHICCFSHHHHLVHRHLSYIVFGRLSSQSNLIRKRNKIMPGILYCILYDKSIHG